MKKLKNLFWFWLLMACGVSSLDAQTVYITRTGAKYHDAYCRYLRQSKIEITLNEAVARGYTACSVCDPPTKSQSSTPSPATSPSTGNAGSTPVVAPPSSKKQSQTQCTASTKSGGRCKRKTTAANGKCWQHQ